MSVAFIAWKSVCDSGFGQSIATLLPDIHFIPIDEPPISNNGSIQEQIIKQFSDVITWSTHVIPADQFRSNGRNILYIERAFIDSEHALYIDSYGWNSSSSISLVPRSKKHLSIDERNDFSNYIATNTIFAKQQIETSRASGPCLIVLQGLIDTDYGLLKNVDLYRPTEEQIILVRSNVSFADSMSLELEKMYNTFLNKNPLWKIENWDSLYSLTNICSGMVSNNREAVVYALCQGIRVATLNRGIYSESCSTLECYKSFFLLSNFKSYVLDRSAIENFLYRLIRAEIPLNSTYEEIKGNPHVKSWLSRLHGKD